MDHFFMTAGLIFFTVFTITIVVALIALRNTDTYLAKHAITSLIRLLSAKKSNDKDNPHIR